ncbi:MAG TPA: hypothetical protein H9881_08145 [Candidatus Stackebrandtia excrementipullorum]|nr:hypothetical protein [Candidatus Stackebrandtia excrementipullorum]
MSVQIEPEALAEVATAVWRLHGKTGTDSAVSRRVRAVVDALEQAGVVAHRYDGMAFDSGLSVRVLAFQPTNGLRREEIIETIRPGVSLHGESIQLGEVIVGTPNHVQQEDTAA